MKQITLSVVMGIALLAAIAFGVSARTGASTRESWEYKSMPGGPGMAISYNHLGHEGWELAAITCSDTQNQCWYYFKRKK